MTSRSKLAVFVAPPRIPDRISAVSDEPVLSAPPSTTGVPFSTGPALIGISDFAPSRLPAPPPAAVRAQEKPAAPLLQGGRVQAAKLIKQVVPQYPALARQARISGVVRLQGIIAKNGTIEDLQVISGHPLLIKAALDAVRQWIYRPTYLNGEAVEVAAPIDVVFTLSQ